MLIYVELASRFLQNGLDPFWLYALLVVEIDLGVLRGQIRKFHVVLTKFDFAVRVHTWLPYSLSFALSCCFLSWERGICISFDFHLGWVVIFNNVRIILFIFVELSDLNVKVVLFEWLSDFLRFCWGEGSSVFGALDTGKSVGLMEHN